MLRLLILVASIIGEAGAAGPPKLSPLDGMPRGTALSTSGAASPPPGSVEAQDPGAGEVPKSSGAPETAAPSAILPKTLANGLYMSGPWSAAWIGSSVSLSLASINNDSFSRTTGTLRLELWAVTSPPARAAGFSGYRLATFTTFSPLPSRTFYSNIARTGTMSYPPDGTYWLVLVLSEFDSINCSQADRFCLQDSLNSDRTSGFGVVAPPPVTLGVVANSLGARAFVSGSATAYGGFSLAAAARVLILVRGNSLGSLGVTQSFMDAPRVRLYNAAGGDLVTQGGRPGFNFCVPTNTATDLPIVQFYQDRGMPVHSRDSCYTAMLGAGGYTFTIEPSTAATSSSATSSTFSGEVLFEVNLARP
jgi:hypothetical protein